MNSLRFVDSITDFFRSPKWLTNLLLGGLCFLIPIVGPLVLMGWHATVFHGRVRRENGETHYWTLPPADWPPFDFAQFVVCLQRGLWPFLVSLVGGFAGVPVILLCLLPVFLPMLTAHDGHPNEAMMLVAVIFSVGLCVLVGAVLNVLLAPFVLRAYTLQDFKAAFSMKWARDYIGRMWKEQILAALFLAAAGLVFALGGCLLLCVGAYCALSVSAFSAVHLQRQLLDLFVQRGGEPLTPASGLLDQPLPPASGASPQPPLPPS